MVDKKVIKVIILAIILYLVSYNYLEFVENGKEMELFWFILCVVVSNFIFNAKISLNNIRSSLPKFNKKYVWIVVGIAVCYLLRAVILKPPLVYILILSVLYYTFKNRLQKKQIYYIVILFIGYTYRYSLIRPPLIYILVGAVAYYLWKKKR